MSYDNSPLPVERNERGFWVGAQQLDQAKSTIGLPYILGKSGVAVPLTGTLVETPMASVLLPGGLMGRFGWLRITSLWSFTNNANNKVMRPKLGASTLATFTATATAGVRMSNIIANRGAENSQVAPTGSGAFADAASVGVGTFAVDTTADQLVTLTGQLANIADSITLEAWMIEVMPS